MAVEKSSATRLRREKQVQSMLEEVLSHLRQLQSAVAVAVGALHEQNADIDADVAHLLQRSVRDPLHEQIDKLEAVVTLLSPPASRRRRPPPRGRHKRS